MNNDTAISVKKKMSRKEIVILIMYVFVTLLLTFTPFSMILGMDNIIVSYSIVAIILVYSSRDYIKTTFFKLTLIYFVVLLLNYFLESLVNLGNILSESFSIFAAGFMFYYGIKQDPKGLFTKVLMYTFCIITVIYAYRTYSIERGWPGIMRHAASQLNYERVAYLFASGLSPYAFPHALTCVLPAFMLGIKINKKWKGKIFYIIMLGASTLLIYVTQSTGALIVAVFALVCSFIVHIGSWKENATKIIVFSLLITPIIVSDTMKMAILDTMEATISADSHYQKKIEELKSSINSYQDNVEEGGDIEYRGNLLGMTLSAIAKSPLVGVSNRSYGNHNALLDRWAEYGLVGFIPIVMFIYLMVKFTMQFIPDPYRTFYIIGVLSNLLMMLSKSMFGWYQWICFLFFLPLMIRFIVYTTKSKKNVQLV